MGNYTRSGRRKKHKTAVRRNSGTRIFFLLVVVAMVVMAFLIRDTHRQLKKIEDMLGSIETLQYEADVRPVMGTRTTGVVTDYGSSISGVSSINNINSIEIGKPIERSEDQVMQRLRELGESSPVIEEIYQNSSRYPERMLEALANNPEMADFVFGYTDENRIVYNGGLTQAEKEQEYPLLLQWDSRWGYQSYGKTGILGLAGCGPTCLSMVLYYLTKDEQLTPDYIAAYSVEHNYYVEETGTAWALMEDLPELYNITVTKPRLMEKALLQELDKGHVIICAMGPGDFTLSGHFIVIYGYDDSGFLVNDPNCIARSNRTWTYDEIESQIKSIWAYGK